MLKSEMNDETCECCHFRWKLDDANGQKLEVNNNSNTNCDDTFEFCISYFLHYCFVVLARKLFNTFPTDTCHTCITSTNQPVFVSKYCTLNCTCNIHSIFAINTIIAFTSRNEIRRRVTTTSPRPHHILASCTMYWQIMCFVSPKLLWI